jgi:hypothetical protein
MDSIPIAILRKENPHKRMHWMLILRASDPSVMQSHLTGSKNRKHDIKNRCKRKAQSGSGLTPGQLADRLGSVLQN